MEPKSIAYCNICNFIPEKMRTILQVVEKIQPCTYTEVCALTKLPTNQVSNRIGELVRVGLIAMVGEVKAGNGKRKLTVYRTTTNEEAERLQFAFRNNFETMKNQLEADLCKPCKLSADAVNLISSKIAYCENKLKLLERFRV